jgi:hypothetical protein
MSGSRLTDMFNRVNPDYLLRGKSNTLHDSQKTISLFSCQGFFPFWSIVLIALAFIFLIIAVIGIVGYAFGCRRPTIQELEGNDVERMLTEDELLLASNDLADVNRKDISNDGYFDSNNPMDYRHDKQLLTIERTRIGHSVEDMV